MSRSGYTEDWDDDNTGWLYRGAVKSAFHGRRGQAFLKEMRAALEALPVKELIECELERADGAVCAIGAVGRARGVDMSKIDPEDPDTVAGTFGIARAMACELAFENDGELRLHPETPAERYRRMREFIESEIRETPAHTNGRREGEA